MNVSALIIGIDGWEQYTLPLVESLRQYEPHIFMAVVDNYSQKKYPTDFEFDDPISCLVRPRERLSYAKAINYAADEINEGAVHFAQNYYPDWYIVLSNDVLCTGPFVHILESLQDDVVAGPQLWQDHGLEWIVGWCVCIPRRVWNALGGWDENYIVSSWEDVDFSVSAVEHGFHLLADETFPFIHLDQKQRFNLIPDYWRSEAQNVRYFIRKHGIAI